jgi:hypothetical protein
MMAASLFLSAKIFESERKIRDILNMIFVVTSLHKIEGREGISMREVVQKPNIKEIVSPSFSVNSKNP